MPNIVPITIKKEGVSDDFYTINELYLQNEAQVHKGDLILCFETSKTAIDMESPASGYIYYNTKENEEVAIGQTIAVISDEKNFLYQDWFQAENTRIKAASKNEIPDVKISKPAQRLMNQHEIDVSVFESHTLITKEDVENYLSNDSQNDQEIDIPTIDDQSIVIFGGGGHAKMCIDIIRQMKKHTIIGIIDDQIPLHTKVFDIPILGKTSILGQLIEKGLQNIVLGVGGILSKGVRGKIFSLLKQHDVIVPTIIHPSASLEPSVSLGEGNQIMQGAIVGSNVSIGNNCIINSGSIISHDTIIGNNVHIAPGAIIGGGVTIKDNTTIGMGCTIFLGLTVGENVVVQNGVHIFNNLDDYKNVKKSIIDER